MKTRLKMGAPNKFFDWNLLDALAGLEAQCNYVAERMLIASGVHPNDIDQTMIDSMHKRINRRLLQRFRKTYVQYVEQKREPWRIKLRSLQRASAQGGNVTMMIWLGKQELGQSDKNESRNLNTNESKLVVEFTTEEGEDDGSNET